MCDVSALDLMFEAPASQSSFPTWGSGCEARQVVFQLGRSIETGNGTAVTPVPAGTLPLRETWSETCKGSRVTNNTYAVKAIFIATNVV